MARRPPAAWFKLLTGAAAATLLCEGAWTVHRQALLASLAAPLRPLLLRHGVTDASVAFVDGGGWTHRVARISGTADAATRAAVLAEARRQPGIADAEWVTR